MSMRIVFTVFFLFTAAWVHGQDLTGIWQGHFRSSDEARAAFSDDRYKFEVQIAQHNKTIQAITYSYLSSVFYGKAEASGAVNTKTHKVLLQEGKLLEIRMRTESGACTMTCFLQYSKSGDEEFLEGSFGSMNTQDSSNCGRGTIFLRKVNNSDFYKEPFVAKREKEIATEKMAIAKGKKNGIPGATKPVPTGSPHASIVRNNRVDSLKKADSLKKNSIARATAPKKTLTGATASAKPPNTRAHPPMPPPTKTEIEREPSSSPKVDTSISMRTEVGPLVIPGVLTDRSNELVRTITVNTNEVTLDIYDDGAIDNDTVSVFLDKKAVVSHAMLTDRAIVVTLHMDETNNYHEVVMVADNEGTIPPNTSLMIVKSGDQQYEVRITSTEQKNAVVIFKYEKPK